MTLEKITKQALLKLVQGQTFEDDKAMKEFLIPELRKLFVLTDPDRIADDSLEAEGNDYLALHILDKETMHDVLIAIIFSTADFPAEIPAEFGNHWNDEGAKYGVVLSPNACRIFDIQGEEVVEVEEVPPLTVVDYEDEKELGGKKYWYWAMNNKVIVIGFLIFVFLLFGLKTAALLLCRVNGQVLTNITEEGAFYYMPGDKGYDPAMTGDARHERRYCSEYEAVNDGWVHISQE